MSRAFLPVKLTDRDKDAAQALRDLAAGKADERQQLRAWAFIVERIAASDDLSFRPDDQGGARDTAFHEGRRFVGLQMRKIATLPADLLFGERKPNG